MTTYALPPPGGAPSPGRVSTSSPAATPAKANPPSESGSATRTPRWLWPAMADVIHALRPTYVIGENVLGHRTKGLGRVLADLADLGYTARAGVVRACEVGAPHPRARLFVLAHTQGSRCPPGCFEPRGHHPAAGHPQERPEHPGPDRWPTEPAVDRVAYGLPDRVDRLGALGNAVLPDVAEHVGRIVLDHHQI